LIKHNFHELKANREKDLPKDVNGFLDSFADKISSNPLKNRLERVRVKRLFGKLRVYDGNMVEVLCAVFQYGMCKSAELSDLEGFQPKAPFLVLFNRSLKNPALDMRKETQVSLTT